MHYMYELSVGFSKKLNIMKLLSSFPREIFSPKPAFRACSYAVSNSNCSFSVSPYMYVMIQMRGAAGDLCP